MRYKANKRCNAIRSKYYVIQPSLNWMWCYRTTLQCIANIMGTGTKTTCKKVSWCNIYLTLKVKNDHRSNRVNRSRSFSYLCDCTSLSARSPCSSVQCKVSQLVKMRCPREQVVLRLHSCAVLIDSAFSHYRRTWGVTGHFYVVVPTIRGWLSTCLQGKRKLSSRPQLL